MITEPYKVGNEWAVTIVRRNGTEYRVRSEDMQSIIDYRNEFIQLKQQRSR